MVRALALVAAALGLAACRQDMHDQPKYKPLRPSAFFADGRDSRPVVEGTVARGVLDLDVGHTTGKAGTQYVANPLTRTEALYRRGHERYDIYCSPCHDRVGTGNGMIVERGFKQPPTFHQDRLRQTADGYLFEVMTAGFGVMPSYAEQVPIDDRWAIAAWIRVLQRSQYATLADVPAAVRGALDAPAAASPEAHHP
jgi:mono/diheme cytochrome c family protein